MIATEIQAREIIARIYGQSFADNVRFVKRHGPSILMPPSWVDEDKPVLAWRKLETGADTTIWLGRYQGFNLDGEHFFDWEWTP